MTLVGDVFPEIPAPRNMLTKSLKGRVSEDP